MHQLADHIRTHITTSFLGLWITIGKHKAKTRVKLLIIPPLKDPCNLMDLISPEFLKHSRTKSMGKQDTAKIYKINQDNQRVNDIRDVT